MQANSENVYLEAVTAHKLPQGISVVSLSQLALAFSHMAKALASQGASATQLRAFQTAIADAAESARSLTPSERMAVRNTLYTAFDGLPRYHSVVPVRADFLRQVRFTAAVGAFGSAYAFAAR
jgi:hypothetical protein